MTLSVPEASWNEMGTYKDGWAPLSCYASRSHSWGWDADDLFGSNEMDRLSQTLDHTVVGAVRKQGSWYKRYWQGDVWYVVVSMYRELESPRQSFDELFTGAASGRHGNNVAFRLVGKRARSPHAFVRSTPVPSRQSVSHTWNARQKHPVICLYPHEYQFGSFAVGFRVSYVVSRMINSPNSRFIPL